MIKNLSFVLLILISFNSNAWWDKGHRMVCDEAYKLLTVPAKKMIDPLIEEHGSFGTACLWADWIKNDNRKDTRSWHYINLPDSEQNTYKTSCPENGCLIAAFHEQMNILSNRSATFLSRAEALWFVGHFIGSPGMNILPCAIENGQINFGGKILPNKINTKKNNFKTTQVGIRPEFINFSKDGIEIKIKRVSDTGRHKVVDAECSSGNIKILANSSAKIPSGSAYITFDQKYTYAYGDNWIIE